MRLVATRGPPANLPQYWPAVSLSGMTCDRSGWFARYCPHAVDADVAILQELTPQESHVLPKPSVIKISYPGASLPLMDVVEPKSLTRR